MARNRVIYQSEALYVGPTPIAQITTEITFCNYRGSKVRTTVLT